METVFDTLSDINKNLENLKKHNSNYLLMLLECAFKPEWKFPLPEGVPPFKANEMSPQQTKGIFWQEINKFGSYFRPDLNKIVKERLFIQALEALDGQSQQILLAVKDQTLDKLFPNITMENLKRIGYF